MSDKKVNVSVNDGMDFFANEASVTFNTMQFILDFKSITPRMDMRSKDAPVLSVKHNVVLVDPYHAKSFHKLLGDVIKNYESKFGKITKPKALAQAEKDSKKKTQSPQKTSNIPNYLG